MQTLQFLKVALFITCRLLLEKTPNPFKCARPAVILDETQPSCQHRAGGKDGSLVAWGEGWTAYFAALHSAELLHIRTVDPLKWCAARCRFHYSKQQNQQQPVPWAASVLTIPSIRYTLGHYAYCVAGTVDTTLLSESFQLMVLQFGREKA